ncbi:MULTISPECIES: hypothetical protein [Rhizobium]|uniref:Lipoprotein n=1 Tax=Rhizobium esperanzae TaxID=1967781 RepID=A0A7W6XWB7_9HYPH|nr:MULTISPECIES: hypothetical protein [Rhizobium]MBB4440272.1 hypothetical protein [Rhizobium esperanzae]MDH6202519.1 hypothetical protein [Rhizobium leguminosarum]
MKSVVPVCLLGLLLLAACSSTDSVEDVLAVKLNELDSTGKPFPASHYSSRVIGGSPSDESFNGAMASAARSASTSIRPRNSACAFAAGMPTCTPAFRAAASAADNQRFEPLYTPLRHPALARSGLSAAM